MITILVDRPIDVVWMYFTKPSNWNKWRGKGYGLKKVVPGWENGATMIWEFSGSSTIKKIIPKKEITIVSSFIDTTYKFKEDGILTTVIMKIESKPKHGASFSDGGMAHKRQNETELQALKSSIESECSRETLRPKKGFFSFLNRRKKEAL